MQVLFGAHYMPFTASTTRVTTQDLVRDSGRDSDISTTSPILI